MEQGKAKVSDVDLGTGELTIDPKTGEMVQVGNEDNQSTETPVEPKENISNDGTPKETEKQTERNVPQVSAESPVSKSDKQSTQTFTELADKMLYRVKVISLVKKKWKDAPSNIEKLEKFLREKNVEVDSIGTSKADIDAWMKTIEDCRQ